MKVYKVVHVKGNKRKRRVSAFVATSNLSIHYPIKKKVVPTVGKVFAFKDYDSARWFRAADYPHEIWEAEATGVTTPDFPIFLGFVADIERYAAWFWSGQYDRIRENSCRWSKVGYIPANTILCDSIKLLRRVDLELEITKEY